MTTRAVADWRLATVLALLGCAGAPCLPEAKDEDEPAGRILEGQLHAHADRSGDSRTPASVVARW